MRKLILATILLTTAFVNIQGQNIATQGFKLEGHSFQDNLRLYLDTTYSKPYDDSITMYIVCNPIKQKIAQQFRIHYLDTITVDGSHYVGAYCNGKVSPTQIKASNNLNYCGSQCPVFYITEQSVPGQLSLQIVHNGDKANYMILHPVLGMVDYKSSTQQSLTVQKQLQTGIYTIIARVYHYGACAPEIIYQQQVAVY